MSESRKAVFCPPDVNCPCYAEMSAELTRLRARVEELERALKPFAVKLDGDHHLNDEQVIECFTRNEVLRTEVRVRDFRAAARALKATP